jgi:hypothetical protein
MNATSPARSGARPTVVAFQGGLGNQLFQWAFATSLRAAGVRVVADTVRCRGDRPLAIGPLLAGWPRSPRAVGLTRVGLHRAGLLGRGGTPPVITERGPGYDPTVRPRVETAGGLLLGYFQSPRYFADVSDEVRAAVRHLLERELTPLGRALARDLAADPDSVAIHVRRGDYVSDPAAAALHGTLEPDHYARALAVAAANGGGGRRIWFSDDPGWVSEHLAHPTDELVPPGATSGAGGEIALMASCRTRIVANSSFSWWAGWLGPIGGASGPVVAPERWFAGSDAPVDDLLPDHWLRVGAPRAPAASEDHDGP